MSTIRSVASRAVLGGDGELITRILCPLISEAGNTVAALPTRGADESLWHIIRTPIDLILGCTGGTEDLLVKPGVIPLDGKQVPQWMPGDLVALTITNPENPTSALGREARRVFSRENASDSPELTTVSRNTDPEPELRVVVRANRRNNL